MNNKKIFDQIINSKEPISIEKYINLCLYSKEGYYIQNQAVGKKGDFTTAPEISQLFGELIGLYIYSFWEKNLFKEFNLVELGPGRGTLLIDILNITKSFKKFNKLTKIFLIEKNKLLKKNQIENFKKFNIKPSDIEWLNDFKIKNNKPTIIVWNTDYTKITDTALLYFDELRSAGIFFNSHIEASNYLNDIIAYSSIDDWWMDSSRQVVVRSFVENFAKRNVNWIEDYKKLLSI